MVNVGCVFALLRLLPLLVVSRTENVKCTKMHLIHLIN